MSDEHDHNHLPERGYYTAEEALAKIMQIVVRYSTYPQGEPIDVTVTATDEEWNAVMCVCQMILISQYTEGNKLLPDFMTTQIHDAFHAIRDAGLAATAERISESLMSEIDEARKEGPHVP